MKLSSNPCSLLLSVAVALMVVRSSRGEAPTIVPPDESPTIVAEPTIVDIGTRISPITASDYIKDCRLAGFDPIQLACTTCSILPPKHQTECLDCCQSYKTLEKRSRRHEMAILINTGFPEPVKELVRDDAESILEKKGSERFHIHDVSMDMQRGMFQYGPSAILWFDKPVDIDSPIDELAAEADDITILNGRGLGRDDVRDMLLTLLPDKE